MAKAKNPEQKKAKKLDKELTQADVITAKKNDSHPNDKAKKPVKKVKSKEVKKTSDAKEPAKLKKDNKGPKPETAKKAGPKSKRAKEEAKEQSIKKSSAKKQAQKPARTRAERRGKKYREVYKLVDRKKQYGLNEAIELVLKTSNVNFDASVEMHINLGVDPKQAEQAVRGTLSLPHSSGKSQRIAVLGDEAAQKAAKSAGADVVGLDNLLKDIENGKIEFDTLVATPDVMPKLGKLGQVLGPKGLMPNPKSGTVTTEVEKTVKELKSGRIEFRIDSGSIIHQVIGKVSYKPEQILENAKALIKGLQKARPSSTKGTYLQKITIATTMGPGIKIDAHQALQEL